MMNTMHKDNFENWLSWRSFRINLLPQTSDNRTIEDLCTKLGYVHYKDFILRKAEIRFSSNETLGIFKLNMDNK